MSGGSDAYEGLLESARGICDGATDLRHACASLAEFLAARLGSDRAILLVRHAERVEGASVGVPASTLDRWLEAVRKNDILPLSPSSAHEGEPSPTLDTPFAGLPDARDFRVIPFQARRLAFSGALFLDTDVSDPTLHRVPEVVGRIAALLARLAELDLLRSAGERNQQEMAHLRAVFDSLPDPVVVLDQENRLVLSNRRADELLVTDPSDSPGRRRAVETNNLFFSAFRAKSVLDAEENREVLLVDPVYGSDLLFEVAPTDVPASLDFEDVSIHILRDITDLKRATAELRQEYKRSVAAEHQARRESEQLNVILANIGVPILVTDEWSDIVLMNHRGARLFETHPGARDSSPRVQRVRANGANITGLISDFLLQPQQRREEELELVDPDGIRAIPVRAVLTKIMNRRGEPTAVVCVIDDLSEEVEIQRLAQELQELNEELGERVEDATKELQERNRELERQREELAKASRLKTEFLAMMSHELRTPINSILGYNSLLRDGVLGDLEERQFQAVERVEASSEHLLSLINDLLDLSKVEAGQVSLTLSSIQIEPFLRSLAEAIHLMAEKKGLTFTLEVQDDIPDVEADPTRLRQVLLNLTTNAVKFTAEGGLALRAFALPDGGYVRFEVEDSGPGIAERDQEAIFEEFYQADPFETREHGGTGLGLSISKKLLSLMDGRLSVRSEPGKGSVFFADVPLVRSLDDAPVEVEPVGDRSDDQQ